jgi:hypothetical protein
MLLLILAFVLAAKAFADFMNWLFRTMLGPLWPKTGSRTVSVQPLTKALGSYLGTFAEGFDSEVGVAFSKSGETVGRAGAAYVAIGTRLLRTAQAVATLEGRQASTSLSTSSLRHDVQRQSAQQAQTAAQLATAEAKQAATTEALAGRVDELQQHVTKLIEPELERLRGLIPALEKGATTTWAELGKHEAMLGFDAMTATVALATARLGMSWTQCDNTKQVGENICGGGGSLLRRLLTRSLPRLGLVELCTLGRLIIQAANSRLVKDALGVFSKGLAELNRCMNATTSPPLRVAAPVLPPAQTFAALPPVHV